MYAIISPDKIAELEQELDDCSLKKESSGLIRQLICGQIFIRDLFENWANATGYQRIKIFKEILKILNIETKKEKKPKEDSSNNPPITSPRDNDKQENSSLDIQEGTVDDDNENDEEEGLGEGEKGNAKKSLNHEEKKKGKKRSKRSNNEFNPVASHIHFHENLKPGDQCPECLKGRVYPFREKIIPLLIGRSPLACIEHRLQTLRCNACGEIFDPKLPEEAPKTGHAMPSAQAVLTLLHYKIGVPFASISDFQKMFCQQVSPAQLWEVIEQTARAVEPVYNELERQAAGSKLFYTDDTTVRILSYYEVNKRNRTIIGRKKASQDRVGSYSSVIIGCTHEGHEIYLYYHGRKYAGENLSNLLLKHEKALKVPIQMKDASTMNIPAGIEVIEAKCNAHAIRKFKDLKDIYPKWCGEVLKKYSEVNKNEQALLKKGVCESERLVYHNKNSLPAMKWIKDYAKELIESKQVEPNSSLGQAIFYFCSHFQGLTAFCTAKGAPFDNNKAERALKMIIRLRKTSMFYKTEYGGEVAGRLQSLLYTAQESGINVLKYLQTILENPEEVRKTPINFLPWVFKNNDIENEKFSESTQMGM